MKEDEYNNALKIDKLDLDNELIEQAAIYYQVSREYAQAVSIRDELYDKVKRVAAKLDKKLRDDNAEQGLRITEVALQSQILNEEPYIQAREEFNNAKLEADILLAQKEAFQQRSYALKDLCGLFISGYFTDSAMKSHSEVVAEFGVNKQREKMKAAREGRGNRVRKKVSS